MIKERNSGISRGFAFIDFPSLVLYIDMLSIVLLCFLLKEKMRLIIVKQAAAQAMMDKLGDDGLVVDGRKLFFEYR